MAGLTSQYQHYIPRFLLRNFSPACSELPGNPALPTAFPNGQSTPLRRHRSDYNVNCLDLSADSPTIEQRPIGRVFGKFDMYRDTREPSAEQNRVEEILSKLENDASRIVHKITDSFMARAHGIWLSRYERNLLRKFLFIMKYRGSMFHHRFYHNEADSYFADDKEHLIEYMRKKGFSRPFDVWLDNIKVISNLDMTDNHKWILELPNRMYPDDANWFINHCQGMYMALCVPKDEDDEFIVTDNSYHVSEGPHCVSVDISTGSSKQGIWTSFHEFAPIAPRIMIVLRNSALPSPLEDANPDVAALRQLLLSLKLERFQNGTVSMLEDLPIDRARNNYSRVVQGQLQYVQGEDGTMKPGHKFFFRFFRVNAAHVNKINGILFDNATDCKNVVFRSTNNFRRTLEWYLTVEPAGIGKRTTKSAEDPRLVVLLKLALVLKQLGSDKMAIWDSDSLEDRAKKAACILEFASTGIPAELLGHILGDSSSDFMKIYGNLGGSVQTLLKDLVQAKLMWRLRVKIDVWSHGLEETLRAANRSYLLENYLQLPRRRFWLYLKMWRWEALNNQKDLLMNVAEDIISQAHSVIKRSMLNRLMYIAARHEIAVKTCSEFDSWNNILSGRNRHDSAERLRWLAVQDGIKDCGIGHVEDLASFHHQRAQTLFQDPHRVELRTRMMVKGLFQHVLEGKLQANLVHDLAVVFFDVVYPTPDISEA
ncbi:hypothetical protein PCL_00832 [Purpureocillium lilacinum]|uniref:DUF4238 domain-containing protein n=1 Tax=Purpureocillium lilacinum TaxID=33203 RepID=A0A2U3DP16_PURLI|nr:hypothetical protein PCL_00832 [Purpureocillium lilacinum]